MNRTVSSIVLARSAAAGLRRAACKGQAELWNEVEGAVEQAGSRVAEHEAASPARRVCLMQCPMVEACEQWARIDRYTGVAAGQVFRNGKPRDLTARAQAELAS